MIGRPLGDWTSQEMAVAYADETQRLAEEYWDRLDRAEAEDEWDDALDTEAQR